ncbi:MULTISPECIES: class I adenylate-forming enzyme family protein [unclassified Crossiella]|uniref:class I adenylate-forming enzyme family protein n=1 Tax=unclassified Crossiella TaxID=2620835 RepID=UPI00200026D7|nr:MULTISPECIES: class I adenylate-forming enzyme family protein [unclassified Crossiella]MCK2244372.1 acyl--CoA ligase [Crossiella sp. S99.2]MCK2257800.1 acyl--CoA ligase [Crossiella sp. S99.1]
MSARAELLATLRTQASRLGERPLLVAGERGVSGTEFLALLAEKVHRYQGAGIGAGAVAGIQAWPPAEFLSDLFAVIGTGAVAVPLPRRLTAWGLERAEALLPFTHLLVAPGTGFGLGPVVAHAGGRVLSLNTARSGEGPRQAATAQLTSGTTGRPRAALRTAAALLAEAAAYRDTLELDDGQVLGCAVPLHHAYGFGLCALAAPLAGVCVHHLSAERPRVLLRELAGRGITLFPGVPPMLRVLAGAATTMVGTDFLTAGMPLDARTADLVTGRLGARLGQVYGTTETGPICVRPPGANPANGAVGPPLPGVEVLLAEPPVAVLTAGGLTGAGLVTVRSPGLMSGYAHDTTPLTGHFTTGDLARWSGGELVLAGRVSTCLNVAGIKVSPEEIEAVLLAYPAVSSCLVSGMDDPLLGQRITALVTPATVDLASLAAFCRERLEPALLPHRLTAVDSLATTETGKVLRDQPV